VICGFVKVRLRSLGREGWGYYYGFLDEVILMRGWVSLLQSVGCGMQGAGYTECRYADMQQT
jgi:hypothetical protein